MRYKPVLLMTAVLMLTACGQSSLEEKTLATAIYNCDDGSHLFIQFKPSSAWIDVGNGQMLSLPKKKVASGIHYASAQQELRGKGAEATWTMGRRTPTKCKAQ